MEHIDTPLGRFWAVQMAVPFTFDGRVYAAGSWILGGGPRRMALTDEHFQERRAAVDVRPRHVA